MQAGTPVLTPDGLDDADILYLYDGTFDYGGFLEAVGPIIPEYADVPDAMDFAGDGGADTVFLEGEPEEGYDVHDLFRRMGIPRLDGGGGFVYLRPLTYLVARGSANLSTEEYEVPVTLRLAGTLAIAPLDYGERCTTYTAIL